MKKWVLVILLVSCLCTACAHEQAETTENSVPKPVVIPEDQSPKRIIPLPCTVDLTQLDNCTLDIALEEDGLMQDESGNVQLRLTVYTYDQYDLVDISRMKPGDTLYINGQDLQITALAETRYGSVLINGGLENGGHELRTSDGGVYYETGYSDVKSYYEIGRITLPLAPDFLYADASDLDQGETIWTLAEFITMYEKIAYYSQPTSTSIVVKNGQVTSLTRTYVP